MGRIIRLTEQDLARIVRRVIREEQTRADFNEGFTATTTHTGFDPDLMKGKTINLYDDQNKQVWDQTWYMMDFTKSNFNKNLTFNLNKDNKKTGVPLGPETGVMTYYCNKPDSFTVSYNGTTDNVSNQLRYNPDVTDKLKTDYCPYVLNAKANDNADFAYQQNAGQGGSTVSESRRRRYRNY